MNKLQGVSATRKATSAEGCDNAGLPFMSFRPGWDEMHLWSHVHGAGAAASASCLPLVKSTTISGNHWLGEEESAGRSGTRGSW